MITADWYYRSIDLTYALDPVLDRGRRWNRMGNSGSGPTVIYADTMGGAAEREIASRMW